MPDWGVHGMGAGGLWGILLGLTAGSLGVPTVGALWVTRCRFTGGLIPGVPWFHVPFSLSVDLGLEAAALGFCPSKAGLQILFKFPII